MLNFIKTDICKGCFTFSLWRHVKWHIITDLNIRGQKLNLMVGEGEANTSYNSTLLWIVPLSQFDLFDLDFVFLFYLFQMTWLIKFKL